MLQIVSNSPKYTEQNVLTFVFVYLQTFTFYKIREYGKLPVPPTNMSTSSTRLLQLPNFNYESVVGLELNGIGVCSQTFKQ